VQPCALSMMPCASSVPESATDVDTGLYPTVYYPVCLSDGSTSAVTHPFGRVASVLWMPMMTVVFHSPRDAFLIASAGT
jgi:hypothetical protein